MLKLLSAIKRPVCDDLHAGGEACKHEAIDTTGSAAHQLAQSVLLSFQQNNQEKGIQDLFHRLKETGRTHYQEHDATAGVDALAKAVSATLTPTIDHMKATKVILERLLNAMDHTAVCQTTPAATACPLLPTPVFAFFLIATVYLTVRVLQRCI